ncbi:DUF1266 domain-containing protein [Streptomyces sp. NPDC012389]|uniref:DUF1266 domain-containing protein n=1 Tax=Streptomyces sp. NPDC012389 TaxID=3364830 RepID=UPI0036E8782A
MAADIGGHSGSGAVFCAGPHGCDRPGRYCAPADAEQAIVHAGALSKSAHRSWEDFPAGYALGRVLRFDEEEYGPFYGQDALAHRLLAESEGSPWRHIAWR